MATARAEAAKRGFDKDPEVIRTAKQVMIQKLLRDEFETKVTPESITDAEVKAYYDAHSDEFMKPEEVRASAIVVKIAAEWEPKWRDKCNGASCETWLRSFLNPKTTIRYFERRHAAAERFGRTSRALYMTHDALIWLDPKLPVAKQEQFLKALSDAWATKYNKQPLNTAEVRLVYVKTLGKPPTEKRECANCAELRAELEVLRATSVK